MIVSASLCGDGQLGANVGRLLDGLARAFPGEVKRRTGLRRFRAHAADAIFNANGDALAGFGIVVEWGANGFGGFEHQPVTL